MVRNYAYKFRIYPSEQQKKAFETNFNAVKFIWNHLLSIENEIYFVHNMYGLRNTKDDKALNKFRTKNKQWFNEFETGKYLTKLNKNEKYSFLNTLPSTSRELVVKHFSETLSKIKNGGGFPKFKNSKDENKSYSIRYTSNTKPKFIKDGNSNKFYLFDLISSANNKIKNLKINIHDKRFFDVYNDLKFNTVTISKNRTNQYYASFQVAIEIDNIEFKDVDYDRTVGIDFGVNKLVMLSNNTEFENETKHLNNSYLILSKKIKKIQKILSNKEKNSNKSKKLLQSLNRLNNKIVNIRKHVIHNVSKKISSLEDFDTIVIEDLKLIKMTKTPEKIEDDNGGFLHNGKKSKASLNKMILNSSMGKLKETITYKSILNGKNVVKVNPKNTSQRCNKCGCIDSKNRLTQSEFKCVSCGNTENADLNASKNIKDKFFIKDF